MNFPALYGILFLSACGCTVICNMYATGENYHTPLNRVFSALGVCLILWTVGFAVTLTASTQQISVIGRRISPLGWGPVFGCFLHYVLLLTGSDKFPARKWVLPALYLPGLITVAAFSVLPIFGMNRDYLVRTNLGWVSAPPFDAWDVFFYSYAGLYLAAAVVLLLRWGKSGTKEIRRQSRLLILSVAAASALGLCADGIPELFHKVLPQLSAVFTILPVFTVSYCVGRYGFMKKEPAGSGEVILNNEKLKDLYRYMSAACILVGTLAAAFANHARASFDRRVGIVFSLTLILYGLYIFLIGKTKADEALKESLIAAVLTVLIPAATWWLSNSVRHTLWVFVFPLIVLCLLFGRKIILTTVIFTSILTQVLLYAMEPSVTYETDGWSYLLRILLICAAGYLAFFVNRTYVRRLKENTDLMESRALLAKISKSFISANKENFDSLFSDMLGMSSRHVRCEQCIGVLLGPDGKSVDYLRKWPADTPDSVTERFLQTFPAFRGFMLRQFREKNIFVLDDAEKLPDSEAAQKRGMKQFNIRGLVCLPVKKQNQTAGFLVYMASYPVRRWNVHALSSLEIIANTTADAVMKINAEQKIRSIAYHDQLTGLPNRLLFRDKLSAAMAHARQNGKIVSVVFLDLDSFKEINDTLGHDMGDQLLIEISEKISAAVGEENTVSRFGGDEFVLLLDGMADAGEVPPVLQRLIDLVHQPVLLNGLEFFVTSSAGAALFPQDAEDPDSLIRYADMAMYAAKKLGKNRYALCSSEIKEEELAQVRLTNLLYRAQEKGQLLLYYQPQVCIATNAIVGMETLLRWKLPDQPGLVSPSVFIPLAEKTGLIQPIGEWVLRTACRQCQEWRKMGLPEIRIAVNVSLLQLRNPNFCGIVSEALEETGLPAGLLELEITESIANSRIDNIDKILRQLKSLGIKLSIDDFGTEYSSLGRLKQLPVDSLKIDIQFVRGIEGSERDQAITKVIISLAKNLHLRITAEGVETKSELDFLAQKMCDEVQGYYYYRPMPAEEAEKVLRSGVAPA